MAEYLSRKDPESTPEAPPYVDSEVRQLHSVLLHRPGAELKRLTPRNTSQLLFDGIPWADRAMSEHDAFAQSLRDHGVEVLYVAELLAAALASSKAREETVARVLDGSGLGLNLRRIVTDYLADLSVSDLASTLIAGLTRAELARGDGIVYRLMEDSDFVIHPIPNLLFTRDSSVLLRNHVLITNPATTTRVREIPLISAIYRYHPRFTAVTTISCPPHELLEGGDILAIGPGVLAIGIGQRTKAAGAEWLARQVFAADLAHTVLVVPIAQDRMTMHLDTVCTFVDLDTVVMYPPVAQSLMAYSLTEGHDGEPLVHEPQPFVQAAASALGIGELRVIKTGLDPVTADREQWDDGNNTLCVRPGLAIGYERNVETNARLEAAGISVIRIPGNELSTGRGGPRCMSCPIRRNH